MTLHVLYAITPMSAAAELRAIARWLAEWAADEDAYHQNVVALGDFNIDR